MVGREEEGEARAKYIYLPGCLSCPHVMTHHSIGYGGTKPLGVCMHISECYGQFVVLAWSRFVALCCKSDACCDACKSTEVEVGGATSESGAGVALFEVLGSDFKNNLRKRFQVINGLLLGTYWYLLQLAL